MHTLLNPISLSVASSVVGIIATPNNPDTPSNRYDYTFICTIHPDSTADNCEVTLMTGGISIKGRCGCCKVPLIVLV